MKYTNKELKLDNIISKSIDTDYHDDAMKPELFIYTLISSKLKRLFSTNQSVFAITELSIIEKYKLNIASKDEFSL